MLSSCKLLGVRSFVPEVGSRSGNDVPVNLHQTNVIVCSDKKGQGPKAQLLPCEVQVLAKRRQVSVGSSLRARSPDPAQPPSLWEPDAQGPAGTSGFSSELERILCIEPIGIHVVANTSSQWPLFENSPNQRDTLKYNVLTT